MLSSTVNSHQGRVNWIYSQKQTASVSEIFGDNNLIIYPGLVPYEELSETEKDYARRTAMETLKLIQKIGFGIIIFYKPFLHGLKNN